MKKAAMMETNTQPQVDYTLKGGSKLLAYFCMFLMLWQTTTVAYASSVTLNNLLNLPYSGHEVAFSGETVDLGGLTLENAEVDFDNTKLLTLGSKLSTINSSINFYSDDVTEMIIKGPAKLLSSQINSSGDLIIDAHSVEARTIVHMFEGQGEQSTYTSVVSGEVTKISADGALTIKSGGTIYLDGVQVNAGDDLLFEGQSIYAKSQVNIENWQLNESVNSTLVDLGAATTLEAEGSVTIDVTEDITLAGVDVKAGSTITLDAENGDINLITIPIENSQNYSNYSNQSLGHIVTKLGAAETIKLIAGGKVLIKGAEIASDNGHLEILAGLGITVKNETATEKFYQSRGDETISAYQTFAVRALLEAGKGVVLNSASGDITLQAVDISSTEGATVTAEDGSIRLLMAIEEDDYAYSNVEKKLFTTKYVNKGHNIQRAVYNTIVGGVQFNAKSGIKIQYEGMDKEECIGEAYASFGFTPTTTCLDQQIENLAKMPGMEWMAAEMAKAKANPDGNYDWEEMQLLYDNWDDSKTTLSPAAIAVIVIVVSIVSAGTAGPAASAAASSYATAAGASAGTVAAAGAAAAAGATAALTQAAIIVGNGAVNGDDPAQIFDDFTSNDTLRAVSTAMVTAGVISYVGTQFFTPPEGVINDAYADGLQRAKDINVTDPDAIKAIQEVAANNVRQLSFMQQSAQIVTNTAIESGVDILINGGDLGDFGDAWVDSLTNVGINHLGQYMAGGIKNAFDTDDAGALDTALKYIAHAGAGCVLGAARASNAGGNSDDASDNCKAGAGGAVVGEFIATQYRTSQEVIEAEDAVKGFVDENGKYVKSLAEQGLSEAELNAYLNLQSDLPYYTAEFDNLLSKGVDLSKLGAAIAVFAAGGTAAQVNTAAYTGENAAENNGLFLVLALPVLLTGIDIAITGYDLYTIYMLMDSDDPADQEQARKAMLRFGIELSVGATVGALIPGDRLLVKTFETLRQYIAENGTKNTDNLLKAGDLAFDKINKYVDGEMIHQDLIHYPHARTADNLVGGPLENAEKFIPPAGSGKRKFIKLENGPKNGTLYKSDAGGNIQSYVVFDSNGQALRRVDVELSGKAHNGVFPPHVVEFRRNKVPEHKGGGYRVHDDTTAIPRKARIDEIP